MYRLATCHQGISFFISFIMAVSDWRTTNRTGNMYFKTEQQLQNYSKEFIIQASLTEFNQTSSPISGLPASVSAVCRVPVQLRAPGRSEGASLRTGSAGGAGKPRPCPKCTAYFGREVLKIGHQCVKYVICQGRDALQCAHTKDEALKMANCLQTPWLKKGRRA